MITPHSAIPDALCDLVARRTGFRLKADQRGGSVHRFVNNRIRTLNLESVSDYIALLSGQSLHEQEFSRLISSVANPHTYFFRDPQQFHAMENLIKRWYASHCTPLSIWCAGCATGEEPYSIAMICRRLGVAPRIYASDINVAALEVARGSQYHQWSLRHLPDDYRERYFTRQGNIFQLSEEITDLVQFKFHNLMDAVLCPPPQSLGRWDWIVCRNVLIYFDQPTVAALARRYADAIARDGYLFLSTTESLHGLRLPFQIVQVKKSFAYQLKGVVAGTTVAESGHGHQSSNAPGALEHLDQGPHDHPAEEDAFTPPSMLPRSPPPDEDLTAEFYNAAASLILKDDKVAGREALERLIGVAPDHLLAHISLGNLYLTDHEFERALLKYKQAQDIAPLTPELHFFQGVLYRKIGDLDRAVQALREALFLQPIFWHASFLLAGVFGRMNKIPQQQQNLEHTLSIIETASTPQLFSSIIHGMKDAALNPDATSEICRSQLANERIPTGTGED